LYAADLGFVGGGLPTTDDEAKEFATDVAHPTRHLNSQLNNVNLDASTGLLPFGYLQNAP
jgi:hypothetical protein